MPRLHTNNEYISTCTTCTLDLPLTEILLSMKIENRPQRATDPTVRNRSDFESMISETHCISCDAFAIIMLGITFATMEIHTYYLTAVRFIADITHKPCLSEINELVGSGAGRKYKSGLGDFGMESKKYLRAKCL